MIRLFLAATGIASWAGESEKQVWLGSKGWVWADV
jgi:hypothetical protein